MAMIDLNGYTKCLVEKLDKLSDEYLKFNYREKIFHYTSFKGLKGILNDRKVRLTDSQDFNDPSEINYGINLVENELIGSFSQNSKYQKPLKATSKFFDNYHEIQRLYISCYSPQIEALNMWRYYTDNGAGVAIGFNNSYYIQNQDAEEYKYRAYICKVKYGDEVCKAVIKKFIDVFIAHGNENDFPVLVSHLFSMLPFLKDGSYKDEKEIRIFCPQIQENNDIYLEQHHSIQRDVNAVKCNVESNFKKARKEGYKKAVTIPEKFNHKDICEIWVGPSCDYGPARKYIEKLLQDNGFSIEKVQVKGSGLPHRDT